MLAMLAFTLDAPLSLRPCCSGIPRCGSLTPFLTGRLSTTAASNSSSSAAAPRRCACCCTRRSSDPEPSEIIDFDPDLNRWGDIWSIFVPGVGAGQLYHFQADGPHEPQRGYRFDPQARLIDPYCKALAGDFLPAEGGIIRPPKCVVINDEFDWQGDRHLRRNLAETIIYEMHVRGFTSRLVQRRGAPRHLPGRGREDPLLEVVGRYRRRVDAGPRVSHPRLSRPARRRG